MQQLRKLVRDLEKNRAYESDEDEDPYASSADEAASDDEEKKSDEEGKEKSTPALPKKKSAMTNSSSKLFMPKKPMTKVKKESVSRPVGRPDSPSLFMNKKKEGSPHPTSPTHKPTSPPHHPNGNHSPTAPPRSTPAPVDQNKKRKPEDVPSGHSPDHKHRKMSGPSDEDLITEQEVIETLRGRKMTTKEFLISFRKRIKKNPRNREVITALLKKVARHSASNDPNTHILELKPDLQRP